MNIISQILLDKMRVGEGWGNKGIEYQESISWLASSWIS